MTIDNTLLQDRIYSLVYETWNSGNIHEMLKSIVMKFGECVEDTFYVYEKDGLEIMYDHDLTIETELEEFLEVYYKDIPVYINECLYGHKTACSNQINSLWMDKIKNLYFEANKSYLFCKYPK